MLDSTKYKAEDITFLNAGKVFALFVKTFTRHKSDSKAKN